MNLKYLSALLLILIALQASAQYGPNFSIPVFRGADSLKLAWVGGLNTPQFSAADLNQDGINDLVIFDRSGNTLLTFINHGTPNTSDYVYEPKYASYFPVLNNWALLLDFNCDNVPDIFTHTALGIKVYKGYYEDNYLKFKLYKDLLRYEASPQPINLLVTAIDIPGIADINRDGDLDILTFDPNGGYIWYFENTSKENGWGCDSLRFVKADACWGKMYEPANANAKLLNQPCPFGITDQDLNYTSRHSGSTTLAFDNTGDGLADIFLGDISFKEICYLINGGTTSDALLVWQDTIFPSYNIPADIPYYPASFRLDLNNDGKLDLVFSPNAETGSNLSSCAWYYKNIGTNSIGTYEFVTDSFLVNEMVDVGDKGKPVFFDFNNDGLMDILISNDYFYNAFSQIATYQNIGTLNKPKFKLHKPNYLNLSSLQRQSLYPAFGDLDGDGDLDMLLGSDDGTLIYYKNNANPGSPALFQLQQANYFNIDIGNYSVPQIVDVNHDNLPDLLIGRLDGKISYYQNNGTITNPDFSTATTHNFGQVNVSGDFIQGFSVPFLTKLPGYNEQVLLVGNRDGNLYLYDSIDAHLNSGAFHLVTKNYSNIATGSYSTIQAADINNDGAVELLIGIQRGGMCIYDTSSTSINPVSASIVPNGLPFTIYPNPVHEKVMIDFSFETSQSINITIIDITGRVIRQLKVNESQTHIELSTEDLLPGIYMMSLQSDKGMNYCKLIKL